MKTLTSGEGFKINSSSHSPSTSMGGDNDNRGDKNVLNDFCGSPKVQRKGFRIKDSDNAGHLF